MDGLAKMGNMMQLVGIFFGFCLATGVIAIEMCDDPIALPEMTQVFVTPVLNSAGGLEEVNAVLHLRSQHPVKLRWFTKKGLTRWTDSLDDSEDFKSTTNVTGDDYTFTLRDKLRDYEFPIHSVSDVTKMIFVYVIMIDENGECNSYSIHFKLHNLVSMHSRGINLPGIIRMPKSHYTLDDDQLSGADFYIVIAPDAAHGSSRRGGFTRCADSYLQMNGELKNARYMEGYQTMFEKQEHYGDRYSQDVSVTCKLTMNDEVQSIMFHMTTGIKVGGVSMWGVTMNVEVRRTGTRAPLLSVVGGDVRFTAERNGAAIIPVSGEEASFFCMAEGPNAPDVRASDGNQLLGKTPTSLDFQFGTFLKYVFYGYGGYVVDSPRNVLGESDYTCSTGTITKKVTVVRFEEVKLKEVRATNIRRNMNNLEVSCETTSGNPKPNIKFFGSPPHLIAEPSKYLESNKDYEITDSNFFQVTVMEDNGKVKGTLRVTNIGDATVADLKGYRYRYRIYCVAYSTYNMDSKMVINWRV